MHPLAIVAPDDGTGREIRDRLADGLAAHGRVAAVERGDPGLEPAANAETTYRLDDGTWTATGDGATLRDVLRELAPDHDYALVTGHPEADVPRLAVGDVDGDDALLAVESAGDVSVDAVRDALEATEPFETLESLVARVKRSEGSDRGGAIATFTGRVRARDDPDDAETTHLEFEKYAGVAEERMREVASELEERDGVFRVLMHHRTGVVDAGEDIVFVVVLAGHRREAFRTVEDGIDRLKAEVPIFKREVTVEESYWVHERT